MLVAQLFHLWKASKLCIHELLFIGVYFVNLLFLLKMSINKIFWIESAIVEYIPIFFFQMARYELIPKRTLFLLVILSTRHSNYLYQFYYSKFYLYDRI